MRLHRAIRLVLAGIVATLAAGALATPASASTVTIDPAPPPPANPPPANPTTVGGPAPEFTFTVDTTGDQTPTCTWDQGTPDEVSGPCSSPSSKSVGVGTHTFKVEIPDDGNPGQRSATYTWDVVPPAPWITTPAAPLSNVTTPTFAFSDSEPFAAFECRVDGLQSDPKGYSSCTSPWTSPPPPLPDGTHTFFVRATEAGVTSAPTPSAPFSIDTSKPLTRITQGPTGTTTSADATFAFESSKKGTFACALDGLPIVPCNTGLRFTNLASRPHTFTVAATDLAGNTDPTPDSRTWTISGAPHAAITASTTTPLSGAPVTFTNASTADDGYSVTDWAWDLAGDGSFNDGGAGVVARSFATPGNHTVRLRVHSQPGNGVGTADIPIHVQDRPPVAGFSVLPRRPVARKDIDLISTASDSDTPIASQTWSVRERGQRLTPAGSAATVRFSRPGTYHVTLRVTDSLGLASSTMRTIRVREQPVAPWLVDVGGLPRMAGSRFTKLRVRARQGARVYVRCRGRRCRVRHTFRKTVGRSANLYVRSFQTFFWAGSVIEVRVADPDYLTKYVRIRIRGHNRRPARFNGCIVPGKRPGRCP